MTGMSESIIQLPPSSVTQRRIVLLRNLIDDGFDLDELRILCFDLGVDYDNLGGEGKTAKACELVSYMKRRGRLDELEAAVHRERPIEPYRGEFYSLCQQLKEWEQVRDALQGLQNRFAPCRGLMYRCSKPERPARPAQRQWEEIFYEVDVEWQPCKQDLNKLRVLATKIRAIATSYDPESGFGPDWYVVISRIAEEIDRALYDQELAALLDHLPAFGHKVDELLYEADKASHDIVKEMNQLRPVVDP
jgi:hypothetical protein